MTKRISRRTSQENSKPWYKNPWYIRGGAGLLTVAGLIGLTVASSLSENQDSNVVDAGLMDKQEIANNVDSRLAGLGIGDQYVEGKFVFRDYGNTSDVVTTSPIGGQLYYSFALSEPTSDGTPDAIALLKGVNIPTVAMDQAEQNALITKEINGHVEALNAILGNELINAGFVNGYLERGGYTNNFNLPTDVELTTPELNTLVDVLAAMSLTREEQELIARKASLGVYLVENNISWDEKDGITCEVVDTVEDVYFNAINSVTNNNIENLDNVRNALNCPAN